MLKSSNLPGAGVMTDTLDFVKNLWGAMSVPGSIPGMAAPTLSVEELDKKINDLKAVEAWLNLNMSMLRGSIQALEVQRGTIATLKAMGNTLSNAVRPDAENGIDKTKSLLDAIPYASAFLFPNANPVPTTPAEMAANIAANPLTHAQASTADEAEDSASGAEGEATEQKPADFGAQIAQASVWWGVLQEQFKQAVTSALASTEASSQLASKVASAAKPKPTPKSSGATETLVSAASKPSKPRRTSSSKAGTSKTAAPAKSRKKSV